MRKSQIALQKQQSRQREALEMKFGDENSGDSEEQGSTRTNNQPAERRQEASQERACPIPQEL